MLIDYEKAHEALLPYYDDLWKIVRGAWEDWHTIIPAEARALASARSRASMIHDFMANRARRLAEFNPSVSTVTNQMMFVLSVSPPEFKGCIGIRLKKLTEDGLSKNQQTSQVQDFRGQLPIQGVDADYHLEAGYVVDRFGLDLQSIDLVCPSGDGIYWKAEIVPKGAEQKLRNLFPHADGSDKREPQEVEVKLRRNKNEEAKNEGKGSA